MHDYSIIKLVLVKMTFLCNFFILGIANYTIFECKSYIRKPFNENMPEFESNRGERVRSKSEKMIADMLALNGVPYKYECPLIDEHGNKIHPDFTILKVRTREIFYWEHCGRLDDPKYARDLDDRMRFYGKLGIFAGDKLLITTEISDNPINMRLAESMMRTVLL